MNGGKLVASTCLRIACWWAASNWCCRHWKTNIQDSEMMRGRMKRGDGKCYTQFDSISNEQYIYIYMDAKSGYKSCSASKQITFDLHYTLWTAKMKVGSVELIREKLKMWNVHTHGIALNETIRKRKQARSIRGSTHIWSSPINKCTFEY